MNNKQLDMILGYLNEGTEIDEIGFLYESLKEEFSRFEFVNENVEILNEGKVVETLRKMWQGIISFFKNVIKKIRDFIKSAITKLSNVSIKKKLQELKSKKVEVSESQIKKIANRITDFKNKKLKEKSVNEAVSLLINKNFSTDQLFFIELKIDDSEIKFADKLQDALNDISKFYSNHDSEYLTDFNNSRVTGHDLNSFAIKDNPIVEFSFRKCTAQDMINPSNYERQINYCDKYLDHFQNILNKLEKMVPEFEEIEKNISEIHDSIPDKNSGEAITISREWINYGHKYINALSYAIADLLNARKLYALNIDTLLGR